MDGGEQTLNSRFGYVSISRASHEATVYTDDLIKLNTQLSADVSKTSALEIDRTPSISQSLAWFSRFDSVLVPIGMRHSTYEQPLPIEDQPMATPYNEDGTPVTGGAHTYPEMAAAGLWTTASDLAEYIVENQ
jgi:hypothetical protein